MSPKSFLFCKSFFFSRCCPSETLPKTDANDCLCRMNLHFSDRTRSTSSGCERSSQIANGQQTREGREQKRPIPSLSLPRRKPLLAVRITWARMHRKGYILMCYNTNVFILAISCCKSRPKNDSKLPVVHFCWWRSGNIGIEKLKDLKGKNRLTETVR